MDLRGGRSSLRRHRRPRPRPVEVPRSQGSYRWPPATVLARLRARSPERRATGYPNERPGQRRSTRRRAMPPAECRPREAIGSAEDLDHEKQGREAVLSVPRPLWPKASGTPYGRDGKITMAHPRGPNPCSCRLPSRKTRTHVRAHRPRGPPRSVCPRDALLDGKEENAWPR